MYIWHSEFSLQEKFAEKAEMYIESKKELNLTVQSGWCSKKSMMDDLNWSANFACIYMVLPTITAKRFSNAQVSREGSRKVLHGHPGPQEDPCPAACQNDKNGTFE